MKTISINKALEIYTKTELAKLCDNIALPAISQAMRDIEKGRDFRIELGDNAKPVFLVEKMPTWRRVRSNKRSKK